MIEYCHACVVKGNVENMYLEDRNVEKSCDKKEIGTMFY